MDSHHAQLIYTEILPGTGSARISPEVPERTELRFNVEGSGQVSALLVLPKSARWLLVLAHGAGAGMTHPFIESLAEQLSAVGIGTFRYQFPYMEQRRRVPDPPAVLTGSVEAATQRAKQAAPGLPLLAGGKSMGGRMTSQAVAQPPSNLPTGALHGVRGLVFFGFPLHPPNRPGTKRADHLAKVCIPMLFLAGTRDTFADLKLLRPVCRKLGPGATLHIIESADHSFHVLKSSKRTDIDVLRELAEITASWADALPRPND
jgi:predicted alpha/beta-hydrolase family hydrolase